MKIAATAVLTALLVAGCGSSKPSNEQVKVQNLQASVLFTAAKISGTPEITIVVAGSRDTGSAYVTRTWQLAAGADPRAAFNTALQKLAAAGVTFSSSQCDAQPYAAQGLAKVASTEPGQQFWPGSVSLLVDSRRGLRDGAVMSPWLQLRIDVPSGKPGAALPNPTISPSATQPC